MKKLKAIVLLFLILVLTSLTTACSISAYQKSIYYDDSMIAQDIDSYIFTSQVGSTTHNESNMKYRNFIGMDTIWVIESDGDGSFTIEYDTNVNKGELKIVLITPDNEVRNILEQGQTGTIKMKVPRGKSRIKAVGNETEGEWLLKIKLEGDAVIRKFD